ncbi:MAG TPA: LuxR C-terminal-related transcriptional regulator [Gaiellaceae bacterium]|nr:LuxR C-terminal-related transcriptional regulator [Gaiellaceae bacterium]
MLVSAPAGYGKSTLAAEWCGLDERVSGWVHLDRSDNDPVILLASIAAALEHIGSVSDQLLEELSRQRPRINGVALPILADELGECSPFVLVLDDTHLVTSEKSLAILAFLADHVPAGSQLMLVARGDTAVPLGRLRASGDLVEVGVALLALDAEETRAVAASGGLELTAESAEALRERTEGWAAAVVLAALFMRGREDAAERAAKLSGDQRHIADYLLEEVLKNQPDELTAFLLGTSILERMSAPLCNAVLRVDNAAESLEALSRSNAFVIPLDDRREWFRYHHLFGELLRAELERRHPELVHLYLVRAASWCEVYGNPDEAFAYAHASGDLGQAGRIALANQAGLTQRGQSETLRLWLDRCTDAEIASDPQLSIAAAWTFGYQGDESRARQFLVAAEHGQLDVPSADGATSLRSALACLRAAVAPDGIGQMLRDAELVCAAEKKAGTRWYFSGARALGMAYVLLGRPQEAIVPLLEVSSSHQPELPALRAMSLAYLAFAANELGDRRDAHRWAAQAALAVEEEHLEESLYSAIASTAGAVAQLERGDHTAAAREVENVRNLRPLLRGARWLDADLALRCADVSLDLGDRPGAVEFAQIAGDALQGYPDAGALPARLERLEERIRLGRDYGLTAAELRLIHFLPTHLSLQEIAERLYLSRPTVKTHVASIYNKLGVEGRSQAVEMIEQLGLGATVSTVTVADPDRG